jgi:GAF domain-containing protein
MTPSRATEQAWTPTEERVEILLSLRAVLDEDRVSRDTVLSRAARVLARSLGDAVAIDLLSADARWMVPIGVDHPDRAPRDALREILGVRFRADEGFTANVVDRQEPVLIPRVTSAEIRALQPAIAKVCEKLGMRGFVAVPLAVRGSLLGILWQIRTRPDPVLTQDDQRFAEEVASRLAFALMCFPGWDAGDSDSTAG